MPAVPACGNGIVVTNIYDQFQRRTNVAVMINGTVVSSTGYTYDNAGRLATITEGTNSATYSYIANSRLIDQIVFKQNGTTRMTTTKSYDFLIRLLSISSVPSADSTLSFSYSNNAANQRTAITNADGSRWSYGYDSLGQVTSGKKYWSDGSIVAGQQFEYAFDTIGNRKQVKSGGNEFGTQLRSSLYDVNLVNQYTSRTVPSFLDVLGAATNSATVTVNGVATSRKGDYYRSELPLNNSASALWQAITNTAVLASGTNDMVTNWVGNIFVPKATEQFTFDADGNLTSDGRWTNKWDAENRLISMTSHATGPTGSRLALHFAYDYQGRRISKVVSNWTGSAWAKLSEQRFIYDGWNLIAVLDGNNALQMSFRWGTDLSGSMQGAGGVGGLISMTMHAGSLAGVYFFAFDGNGNVAGLVNASNGTLAAVYEYDPFGRVLRSTGPLASSNPFRFSTKWQDDETGFLYYGHRYYDPETGRWQSRDLAEEKYGQNLYRALGNKQAIDYLGLYDLQYDWFDGFTKAEKGRLLAAFAAVKARVDTLIPLFDAEIARMNAVECAKQCHKDNLAGLRKVRDVMKRISRGIASSSENLEVEKSDLGTDSARLEAIYKPGGEAVGTGWDPILQLNINKANSWTTADDLEQTILHELSHIYGTEDDDSRGPQMNAEFLEFYYQVDPVNYANYLKLLRDCDPKTLPPGKR